MQQVLVLLDLLAIFDSQVVLETLWIWHFNVVNSQLYLPIRENFKIYEFLKALNKIASEINH